MIVLDTNFLIAGLVPGTAQDARLRQWLESSEPLAVSVIAWAEFLCGPVTPEHVRQASRLFPSPVALLPEDAARAAELYNATGRRRGSLADCLIAATCLRLNAAIATDNTADFCPFEPHGLRVLAST
ncbi:MAG: type II toxin-antitoxin system VapC family toxin [Phycisphaerales bacterium]|nr:MAG: type II toxin-antitoxin system VapC family toxin [Phycisphaerales bacterium]